MKKPILFVMSLMLIMSMCVFFGGCKDKSGDVDVANITQPGGIQRADADGNEETKNTDETTASSSRIWGTTATRQTTTRPTSTTTRPTTHQARQESTRNQTPKSTTSDQSANKKPTQAPQSDPSPSSIVSSARGNNISSFVDNGSSEKYTKDGSSVIANSWDDEGNPTSYRWRGVTIKIDPETGEIL